MSRTITRLVSFTAAFALVAAVSLCKAETKEKESAAAEQSLGYTYSRSLAELAAYVDNIDTSLEKAMVSGTDEGRLMQAAKVWRESAAAKACLSSLPYADQKLENTNKFLSQVGEYSYSLARRAAAGEPITAKEGETVKKLAGYAENLKSQLYELLDTVAADGYDLSAVTDELNGTSPAENGAFVQMEGSYEEYPSLIYDGPFSDHLQQGKQKALENEREITKSEAEAIAKAFTNGVLTSCDGKREGTTPVYCFYGDGTYLELTVKGGKVLNYVRDRAVQKTNHTREEAVAKAKSLLAKYGLSSMQETYTIEDDNTLLINFAYAFGGTVCYPDLIKLRIALDDLSLLGAETSGFLANHTSRQKPTQTLSADEARKSVSPALTVLSVRTAFICPQGLTETFVYEFTCRAENGRNVLCYIDAVTGREADLLLLLETPGGLLTV